MTDDARDQAPPPVRTDACAVCGASVELGATVHEECKARP